MHGARARGQSIEFAICIGDLIDGVKQCFSGETLGVVTREIVPIHRVVVIWKSAELVGLSTADGSDQLFQIVVALDEEFCQRVEEFGIGRRVCFAHVILGIDQAAIKKVFPIAVD